MGGELGPGCRAAGLPGCRPAPVVVPAAGRQDQHQKLAIRGMAGWVRLRGTLQVRPCSSVAASMRLTPPQPDPPRLRQFPVVRGVGSRCSATGSDPC
ncbi:hypothetical protein FOB57_06230 [Stenotrophomonas maltophilia]|nr:hypothetical protein FOB57_06230 [Stenotrophomonas maltophilia]